MIGEGAPGKSSLLTRYANGSFSSWLPATVGIDFKTKHVDIDGTLIDLLIWDTSGQERCRADTLPYLSDAHGIMLVYDVTDRRSFESIRTWIPIIKEEASTRVSMVLVGNKRERLQSKVVSTKEGRQLASDIGIPFYECSAKYDVNVDEAFTSLADAAKDQLRSKDEWGFHKYTCCFKSIQKRMTAFAVAPMPSDALGVAATAGEAKTPTNISNSARPDGFDSNERR